MNSCLNCKWASWEMTNHKPPRVNPRRSGRCHYKVPLPVLPAAPVYNGDYATLERLTNPYGGRAIWAKNAHTDCPTWEGKDGD